MTIASGATLDVNGVTQQIGSLSGPVGSAITLGAGQLIVNSGSATQFSGTISGSGGSLVKGGTGTLTLTGNHSYTGATTVNGGTLRVSGLVGSSSKVWVGNTGTFEAAGAAQTLKAAAATAGGTLRIAPSAAGPVRRLTIGDGTHWPDFLPGNAACDRVEGVQGRGRLEGKTQLAGLEPTDVHRAR